MTSLKLETLPCSAFIETKKITGFLDGELSELKSMKNSEAREKLLDMLDKRNHGAGTAFMCGYGVYGIWFDNEAAYMNVGKSCD